MNLRLSLALLPFLPVLLFGQVKTSAKDIKIISATKENWSPGTVQNNSQPGGGMIYQVIAEIKKSGEFNFDSLVTAEGSLLVEVTKNNSRNYKGPFKKGDRLVLIAYQKKQKEFQKNSPAIQAIVSKNKNEFFYVSYRIRGRRCLARGSEFQKKNPGQLNQ